MLSIHCEDPWFSKIKSGEKKVEGRKNALKYQSLKKGDLLRFYFKDESLVMRITKIVHYKVLEEYLVKEGIQNALPGASSLEEALAVYHQWSSDEEIAKVGGFLGIHLETP